MKAGWEVKALGDAFQTATGSTPPKARKDFYGNDVPLVKPPELIDNLVSDAVDGLTSEGRKVARIAPAGSILVSCIGNLGKIGLAARNLAFNQQINAIFPNNTKAISEFMFYQVLSPQFKSQLEALATGTTVPIVNKSRFNSITVNLPPLAEQKRIVSILDEAFEGLDRARENAEANLKSARELFESGLDAVIADAGKDCIEYSLSDLCVVGDGNHSSKYPKKSEMVAVGVPFIRSTNIQKGSLDTSDLLFISPEKHAQLKKGHLKTGDVLFTNRGEIGKVAIVPNTLNDANLNSQVAWLRCLAGLDEHFLFYFLQSSKMKRHYLNTQSGTGLQQFTIKMLKSVMLLAPPIERQQVAMQKLNRLNVQFKAMENSFVTKLQDIADLRQSLLQKAFAGELT